VDLLPQRDSFEGLSSVEVVIDPHDLSVAQRGDLCKLKLRYRPAARAASALPHPRSGSCSWC
jgi:hypothetical protein